MGHPLGKRGADIRPVDSLSWLRVDQALYREATMTTSQARFLCWADARLATQGWAGRQTHVCPLGAFNSRQRGPFSHVDFPLLTLSLGRL